MIGLESVVSLVQSHGLLLLAPLAIMEGPIVTVVAGSVVQLGLLGFVPVYIVVVLGDLIGDALFYLLGRWGLGRMPLRWRARLGLRRSKLQELGEHFRTRGGRTRIIAKLTHSLGFVALAAAGASRMPFGAFLWYNLMATLPKCLAFLLIGYSFGYAYAQINHYIYWASLGLMVVLLVAVLVWYLRQKPAP